MMTDQEFEQLKKDLDEAYDQLLAAYRKECGANMVRKQSGKYVYMPARVES